MNKQLAIAKIMIYCLLEVLTKQVLQKKIPEISVTFYNQIWVLKSLSNNQCLGIIWPITIIFAPSYQVFDSIQCF
jgi:hypothetical protein